LAAVIELQIQADIKQAAAGLQTMLTQLTKLGTGSESQAKVVQSSITKLITASKSLQGLDFGTHFEQETKKISDSAEAMQAKAAGMEKLFESFGTNVNLSGLVAAFQNTDKSVEALEAQMVSLQQAIALTADPIILQRFGDQLNKLQSQLAAVKVVGAVKVEKIDIPRIDVPLVAPKIDVSQLKALQASFNDTIDPVTQLENRLKGLQDAVGKSTNPVLVASFRAEIEKLKTQLTGLKFDKIDVDPTSLRVLQSAFIDANKPLEQLQREISVVDDVLKQATANGSKDVGRLRDVLVTLNAQFAKVNASSLETAFDASIKSAQQLKNEIYALSTSITLDIGAEDVVKYSDQIKVLQNQLNSLKFGGIDLQIDTSSLSRLQSAFIETIKPAEQLEQEIEALEQALNRVKGDPTSLKVYGNQIVKLKQQLANVNVGAFETSLKKVGKAAQEAGVKYRPFVKGSNEAMRATIDLGRVLQDAPFGFIGIANNINPLIESFANLKRSTGGIGATFKALAGSLIGPGGIGLALSAFQFIALDGVGAVKKMFGGFDEAKSKADKLKKATQEAKEAAEDFIASLNDIAQTNLVGRQNAQGEIAQLNTLYQASQNANLALSERKKAVDELQKVYPAYFKNISDEVILNGGAVAAYDKLTAAIIASAVARAREKKIMEVQQDVDTKVEQRNQSLAEEEKIRENLAKLTKEQESKRGAIFDFDEFSRIPAIKSATQALKDQKNTTNELNLGIQEGNNRVKEMAQSIQDAIKLGGIDAIIGKPGEIREPKIGDGKKINFFDKFFDLTPPENQIEQQVKEMADVAKSFAQKNIDLFKVKVGDKFIDLSELDKVSDRREVVELGKKVWESIQNGLVQFKPPRLILENEVLLVPTINDQQVEVSLSRYADSLSGRRFETLTGLFDIPDRTGLLDTYVAKFNQIGSQLPQLLKVEDVMGNLQTVDLQTAFDSPLTFNFQSLVEALRKAFEAVKEETGKFKEEFQSSLSNLFLETFSALGNGIGAIISGSGISEAFAGLFSFIGGALQDLGKQMIAMSALFAALKKAIQVISPVGSLLAGVGLIALGGIIKNIKPKGFAAGGLVFGPTLGLVGEGSGTSRSNPEVIAPLDKLKNYISGANNGGFANGQLVSVVRGKDIALVYERFNGYSKGNA
jgi:hypothetical protein